MKQTTKRGKVKAVSQKMLTAARPGRPFYVLLGLDPEASPDQVAKQWRSVAACHHPDVRGGETTDLYRALSRAAEVLLNPDRRKIYDVTGLDSEDRSNNGDLDAVGAIGTVINGILDDLVLGRNVDPDLNILQLLRDQLREGVETREHELMRRKAQIENVKKVMAELEKRWTGIGPAKMIAMDNLSERLDDLNASLKTFEGGIAAGRRALEMLAQDNYEDVIMRSHNLVFGTRVPGWMTMDDWQK